MKSNKNDVLSLFNGASMGRVALDRAGIKYGNYYSSEIDKHCKKVSRDNYPNIFELGSVENWEQWGIDFSKIGIIFAGFPCQPWSTAGKGMGIEDLRGQLVYPMIKIWKHITKLNPDVKFLFENVKMSKDKVQFINNLFCVEPILINSNLVSAQNRNRYYWTNIPNVTQPEDKKIFLKHVVAWSRSTRYPKGKEKYIDSRARLDGKANTLTTGSGCSMFSSKNMILENYNMTHGWVKWWNLNAEKRLKKRFSFIVNNKQKSICLTARQFSNWNGNFVVNNDEVLKKYENGEFPIVKIGDLRKLTPVECERLQTLPDNYTAGVSDSQRYKIIGNGWTVDVIAHILNGLKIAKRDINQMDLEKDYLK